jgi:integrase
MAIGEVDKAAVLRVITPIWSTKTETASRVRARIENIIGWAMQQGHRPEGPNPAAWRGALQFAGLPKKSKVAPVEHQPALPWSELPDFIARLRGRHWREGQGLPAKALEFAILTAARTGEVIGARWSEIDLEARLWTIPAERMKAGREHRVPLSGAAMAILEGLERKGTKVFPVSDGAMLYVLQTTAGGADVSVHGFRSTFADWAMEQTDAPHEVREMALAHAVGDKVEKAYRRGDLFEKRRRLAEAWAAFCAGEPSGTNVVSLRMGNSSLRDLI